MRRSLAVLTSVGVVAAALVAANPAQAAETIPGGGATFPQVLLDECRSQFNGSQNNFNITYQGVGSGRGQAGFTNGTYVFGGTDSAYSGNKPSFQWSYVPMIGGAITLPVNLNGKNGRPIGNLIQLRQGTIAKIFGGQITKWDHPEIRRSNRRIANNLPNADITIVYRSDGSGTTNNFLQYLNAWNPTVWTRVQNAMDTAFPGGRPPANSISGSGNPGVLSQVLATPGAIGYVDLGDALKNNARTARVQNALGEFVVATSQSTARNLANQTNFNSEGLVDLNYNLRARGAYPLSIFSYFLVRTDGGPNGLGVRQFVRYVLERCAPAQAAQLGFAPVGGRVRAQAVRVANEIK